MDEFFYNLQYGLENETVWKKLAGKWDRLLMSPLTIDIRLVSAIYYSPPIHARFYLNTKPHRCHSRLLSAPFPV